MSAAGLKEGGAGLTGRPDRLKARCAIRASSSVIAPQTKKRRSEERRNTRGAGDGTPAFFERSSPRLLRACGQIPKNVPLARFLNGISPHRFESRLTVLKTKRARKISLLVTFPMERVTGLEPADTSLGSWGLTTWRHPRMFIQSYRFSLQMQGNRMQRFLSWALTIKKHNQNILASIRYLFSYQAKHHLAKTERGYQ